MQQITVGRSLTRRSYNTGLWTDGIGPAPPYLARGFAYGARFYRYRGAKPFDERERLLSHIGCFPDVNVEEWSESGDHCWQSPIELVIFASPHDRAKSAANRLVAAMLLLEGQSLVHERVIPLPDDREELDALHRIDRHSDISWSHQRDLCEAAALAAKLSHREKWRYAVAKYWVSHRICSVPWMDTHPTQGKRFGVERDPFNHVLFAQAIIAAYSVIEELQFHVYASDQKPSRINGKWNPVVETGSRRSTA